MPLVQPLTFFPKAAAAPAGPTLVVEDHFLAGADTTLASWTPDTTGTGYTAETLGGGNKTFGVIAATDDVQKEGGIRGDQLTVYSVQPNPSGPDQEIEVTWKATGGSSDDPILLLLRADTGSPANAYGMRGVSGGMTVHKIVGGTPTQLSSFTGSIGNRFRFRVQGSDLQVFENDVEIPAAAASDNNITQTGRWGIAMGNLFVAGEDIDAQTIDDLKCWDL